jgi:hypothetical protein
MSVKSYKNILSSKLKTAKNRRVLRGIFKINIISTL